MSDTDTDYRGKKILIRFDGKKCIHSRHCVLERPDVFLANVEGPWIQPDNAAVEDLVATSQNCPSGAITYARLDGGAEEAAPLVNTVKVRENGPLAVRAEIQLAGQPASLRATLCRCGASKNKPFCDGSHGAAGFHATGEPGTQASEPLAARGGPLAVTPAKNGPLVLTGNVEVLSGTGRTVTRTQRVALCRCGQSANKPFCDGTHGKIGFQAD